MKAYVGEVRKLECHFNSLKLEHVPLDRMQQSRSCPR
jgi:hypothetical protein